MADNLAYDLSLFENRQRKTERASAQPPKVLPQSRLRTAALAFVRIMAGALVGLVFCAGIYSRVTLTERVAQIEKAQSELAALQNEYTRLNMQLDSKISFKSIEDYAVGTLGLNRAEKYQISYLSLSGDDKIEALQQNNGFIFSIPDINELFYALVEYIN